MDVKQLNGDTDDLVRLSFFVSIGKAIMRARTIDETLKEIMSHIGEIFTPLNWSILLKNPKTGDLTFAMVVGKNADVLRGLQLPQGEGIAGWIAETGRPCIVEDVSKDSRFSNRVDAFTGFRTESIIGVPLVSNDRVFGVIELINKLDGEPFTPFDLKVLTTIADFAAIAIEKAYYARALKRLATLDSLTGAYNRGAFERMYAKEIEMCRRYEMPLSLLMVDIDNFKEINDTHGHPAGDRVLQNLVELLTDCVRKVDYVCRYGGDEFIILLPNTAQHQAEEARKRIQKRVEYQNSLNPEVPYSISVGLHSIGPGEEVEILELVDLDLYRQKDKKLEGTLDNLEEHLEEMLKEERTKLKAKGKDRRRN
ncbi:MAG: sensor domain-containing diguanylate cyclase [Thermodesulfobacteriota bacterium]